MINSLIYRLKNNKLLFAFAIIWAVVTIFDLAVIIFNIVELIISSVNPAMLVSGFLTFNIIAIAINFATMISVIIYIIFRKR